MNNGILLGLINNTALLLAIALLFDVAALRWKVGKLGWKSVPIGIILGGIGIGLMLTPWQFSPGIIFDTRSILLTISGLFFGLVPTVIAMLMTATLRYMQGGAAMMTGISVIVFTGSIGILWRHRRKTSLNTVSWRELYILGVINHLVMLALMFLMPLDTALAVLRDITFPVLVIYPVGTTLLGILMVNRLNREQINQTIKEREEQMRLAVEGAQIGFFSRNLLTDEVQLSLEWKNLIGYQEYEVKNHIREWIQRLHPEDRETTLKKIDHLIQSNQSGYEIEYRLQHKDGTYRWILERGFFTENQNGQPPKLLGCNIDITRQKETEAALRESETKFRQIFDTAGIGISIADLDGNIITGNPAILEILGYTLEEYKKLSVQTFTHPEDLDKNLQIYQNYRDGKQDSYTLEKRNFRKNGEIVWGQLTSTVVRDENGRPLFTIGMFEDITDRKQAQAEMKQLLDSADLSRRALLSVVEDQKITEEALTKLTEDLITAYDSTLKGWSNALELREQETAGHSKRVVSLTLALAQKLGVTPEELTHIERGALLHDIGKMGIPDSILLKPGPLTEDEWVTMRLHPEYAYRLLSEIDYLKPALDIPYSHHERWDGSGYPRGLSGSEIPLAARIFAVIDVWDALLSDRPYRPAWSKTEVIKYLKNQAGKQFDPYIVEQFLELIKTDPDD